MMWSNFLMQEEDRRRGAAARRGAGQPPGLSPEREGKVKLALLLTAVGATLAVLAVGTEFWVELNTVRANDSAVCDAAYLGLWKVCVKRLWQEDVPAGRRTCGPAQLPGGEAPGARGGGVGRRGRGPPRRREGGGGEERAEPRGGTCTTPCSPRALAPRANLVERESLYPRWLVPQASLYPHNSLHP